MPSPDTSLMYTYGLYLLNGGTSEDFMSMSDDDIQAMYTSAIARDKILAKDIIIGISKIFSGSSDSI